MYHYARQFVGRPVWVHCHHGKYTGILQRVTPDGIWLQPLPGRTLAGGKSERGKQKLTTADRPDSLDAETVQFFFGFGFPFFIPFFSIFAFRPFFWW
ncbi:hypothetical protein [Effusibacillus pohliae]|uniref:hypothetical protein n=1 Tax=Effusibacillus pohliae TaxID=232270 RepID=UPI0003674029|nr:hypothetical protein [Effusibacillus pohliae]